MVVAAVGIAVQTATPTPGTGPAALGEFWPTFVRAGWFLAGFLVVVAASRYVLEPAVARTVGRRNRGNPTIQDAVSRYLRVFVVAFAVLVGATVAGFGRFVTGSAIVVAALTLALGVAGQTVVGSLISGLVLVLDPEFNVGNYIEWETGEGTVESITLRVTRVQTPDGGLATVPNTVLTGQTIGRPYGRDRSRIVERIGIAYDADVEEAMRHLEAAAREPEGVLADPAPAVYVEGLGDDGVVLQVQYWIENSGRTDVLGVRSAFARAAKTRLEGAGIGVSPASQRELQGRIEVADSP